MKKLFLFCGFLLSLLPIKSLAQTGDERLLENRVKVPKEIQGRWYSKDHKLFIDFQDYGLKIENQIWAYFEITKIYNAIKVKTAWKGGPNDELEILIKLLTPHQMSIQSSVSGIFPDSLSIENFAIMHKWQPHPETPAQFKENLLLIIDEKFHLGESDSWKTKYKNILQHKLTDEWFKNAKKLDTFPEALQGFWNSAPVLPVNTGYDSFCLAIFKSDIIQNQYSIVKLYPTSKGTTNWTFGFINIENIYAYKNLFLCSSNKAHNAHNVPYLFELKNDSLFVEPLDINFYEAKPIILTNKQKLNEVKLPKKALGIYANINAFAQLPLLGVTIYPAEGQMTLSEDAILLQGQHFPIRRVFQNQLYPTRKFHPTTYTILATDVHTGREKYFSLEFNRSFGKWLLEAYDLPFDWIGKVSVDTVLPRYKPSGWALSDEQLQYVLIFISTLIALLIVIFVAWLTYFFRKRKQAQIALRGLRAQLNPHFLFNALNSIQSLVNQRDTENANRYLSGFSKLMRHTLDNSGQDYLPLQEELNALEQYCQLESLRSPFEYHIKIDPVIDPFNTEIPNMLLQPYVENAILHGLRDHPGNPLLEIFITKQGRKLICEITDNGPGIPATQERSKGLLGNNRKQHGMKLSEERLQLLNLRRRKKITLQILDRQATENQSGTRVVIKVPE